MLNNLSQVPWSDSADSWVRMTSRRVQGGGNSQDVRANQRQVRAYNQLRRAKSTLQSSSSPRVVYNSWNEYQQALREQDAASGSWTSRRGGEGRTNRLGSAMNQAQENSNANLSFNLIDTYRLEASKREISRNRKKKQF